jgi:hypothetical protein
MSIVGILKQISVSTLEILREEPLFVELFLAARYLPEAAYWRQVSYRTDDSAQRTKERSSEKFGRFRWADKHEQETLKNQFMIEWEIPELDLHKYYPELTFLLAGYVPHYISSEWTVPELKIQKNKDFLTFLVIDNSKLDGLPLVNAIGAGAEIRYDRSYGPVRYLLLNEVEQIFDGLLKLSKKVFQQRYRREAKKENPCYYIDWSEQEMLKWMTRYYNQILYYYRDAAIAGKAMLLYLV